MIRLDATSLLKINAAKKWSCVFGEAQCYEEQWGF
jgi:hypothetical protein